MTTKPQWSPMPFTFVKPGEVLASGVCIPLVSLLMVALRIYTRKGQKQVLKADDWLIIPAFGLLCGMAACLITGYELGVMGYPTPLPYGVDPMLATHMFLESYEKEAKIEFAFQLCQVFSMGLIKLSVIWFCRRIFIVYKGSAMDWATFILAIINICWTIAFALTLIFGCRLKPWLHWAPLQTDMIAHYCGDLRKPLLAAVISDFILEFTILMLPLPSIWMLQVSRAKRIGITGIFLIGLMSVVASLIKMSYFIIVLVQPYDAGYDINQTVTTMLWWGMLQVGLAIIAACLPTIYALRKRFGINSLQSMRDNIKGSFSWLRSGSKTSSDEKDVSLVDDTALPPAPQGSEIELQEVYFTADGKMMQKEE